MDINTIVAQAQAFNAWMAELPEPRKIPHDEIYEMICDKVGESDVDSMAEQILELATRLGVVIEYSEDEDEEGDPWDSESDSDDGDEPVPVMGGLPLLIECPNCMVRFKPEQRSDADLPESAATPEPSGEVAPALQAAEEQAPPEYIVPPPAPMLLRQRRPRPQ